MNTKAFFAVLLSAALGTTARAALTTNSWTDGSSKWETAGNWSLGAPALANAANLITNAGNNTITIDAATTNSPSMTISNLVLSAPANATNSLALTNAGLLTPLRLLNAFTIQKGGALLVTNSIVRVDGGPGLTIDGGVTVRNLGTIITSNLSVLAGIGVAGTGSLTIDGGAYLGYSLGMGGIAGALGTLTLASGTMNLSSYLSAGTAAGSTGVVWMTGGQLVATNSSVIAIGDRGLGQMTVSNGTAVALAMVVGGNSAGPGAVGTFTMAGGTNTLSSNLTIGNLSGSTGAVWVTGGQLVLTNNSNLILIGQAGVGQMTVSNGTVLAQELRLGTSTGALGTLTVAGGVVSLKESIEDDLSIGFGVGATGTVWLTGGQLISTNNRTTIGNSIAAVGQMTVSNGAWLARDVSVGNSQGTLTVAGGTNTLLSSLFIVGDRTGTVWVTGGQLSVTNDLTYVGYSGFGQMTVSNGTWLARDVMVGNAAGSQGTLTIAGGSNNLASLLTIGNLANATGTVWLTGGQLVQTLNPITIGSAGVGQMTVSNGSLQASSLVVAQSAGSRGTFTCAGGTNTVAKLDLGSFAGATGTVWITGGKLSVSPQATQVGVFGLGRMTVSNGTFLAGSVSIPGQVGVGAQGTLTIAGGEVVVDSLTMNDTPDGRVFLNSGTLTAGSTFIANGQGFNVGGGNAAATLNLGSSSHLFNNGLDIGVTAGSTGVVTSTGFSLTVSNGALIVGDSGVGQMGINSGTAQTREVVVGNAAGSQGALTIAGGTNNSSSFFTAGNLANATGTVWVTSGKLIVTNNTTYIGSNGVGQLTISNTTVLASNVIVAARIGSRGTITLAAGTLNTTTVLINTNGVLRGCGTVTGNVTVNFGGTNISDCGNLSFTGIVTNNGALIAQNGAVLEFYGPVVNNASGVIDASVGNAIFHSTFINNGIFIPSQINSWTNSPGGKWETGVNWSMGVAPASSQIATLITNAGNKTVGIDATTSSSFPASMTISNLTVSAPVGSTNTLSLTNAGLVTPLRVLNAFTISSGGAVAVTNAMVRVDNLSASVFAIDGSVRVLDLGLLVVTNGTTYIGYAGSGSVSMDGGTYLGREINLGNVADSQCTLTLAGGTNALASYLSLGTFGGTGTVWVMGGQLAVTNNVIAIGDRTVGQMTVSNGTVLGSSIVVGGNAAGLGSVGTFTIAGGTTVLASALNAGSMSSSIGALWLTGGQLTVTNNNTQLGYAGVGQMTVSGGTWLAGGVFLGHSTGSQGTLTVAGGTNTLSSLTISAGPSGANSAGTVWLTGGQLTVTNGTTAVGAGNPGTGQMTVSNGTWLAGAVLVGQGIGGGGQGTLTLAGGTNTLVSSLSIGPNNGSHGAVWLTGGQLIVTNAMTLIGDDGTGQMMVSNGAWLARDVYLVHSQHGQGTLTVAGGTNTLSSILEVGCVHPGLGGQVWLTGGQLAVTNNSTYLGYAANGTMTVSNGTWLARDVYLGYSTFSQGTLTVNGGIATISSNLIVGNCGLSLVGKLTVTGGALAVTNDSHTAYIDVRDGTFTVSGGSVVVDVMVLTNSCGYFVHTGGDFSYSSAILDPNVDTDGDGLPNGWEQAHGLDPLDATGANGASGDPDGDGLTNLQEYQLGSDPVNGCSPLCINSITRVGNDIRIQWTALGGTTNVVETAPQPGGSYSVIGSAIAISGIGLTPTNYLDIGGATNAPARFYRIELVPANFASDNAANAAYSGGWTNGSNGGIGFGAWALTVSNGMSGTTSYFIGSSLSNGTFATPGIDTTGEAWGMSAQGSAATGAYRMFGGMQIGQTLSFNMDYGFVDGPPPFALNQGNFVGFCLRSSGAPMFAPSDFVAGADLIFQVAVDGWRVTDAGGTSPPIPAPPTGTSLRLRFTLTGPITYTLLVINNTTSVTNTFVGPLIFGPIPIDNICLLNYNAGASPSNDVYYNSLRLSGIPSP